tara:strand:+ start:404 stop:820 length:417 start_codon:yes stop_codon:yes gene_type:complete
MSDYEHSEGDGTLFQETKVTVPRKGKILLDGQLGYYSILKYEDGEGDERKVKYELCKSVGVLYINTDKKGETSPDLKGPVTIDGKKYRFNGYKKVATNGKPFTGVKCYPWESAEELQNKENMQSDEQENPFTDDDIPF